MFSDESLHRFIVLLDTAVRVFLIWCIPLIVLFVLGKLVFPVSKALKVVRFRGLPSSIEPLKNTRRPSKWARHLVLLLRSISAGEESDEELLHRFIIMTIGTFISTYIVYGFWTGLFTKYDFQYSDLFNGWQIFISMMASFLPYCFLRMKLHRVRVKNSYDLVPAVNTLILKYSEYRGNLYYAVFETTKVLQGDILNAFVGLLPALQGSANASIEDAIELFIYRIKTTWAIQLGILIHKSEEQGDNIEQGLRWLITDMSEVAKITEEIKSENRETIQLAYFPVFLFPAVIYFNQFPSMGKSWHYYFQTTPGIRMIMFTLLYTFICAVIAYTIQKPRNEV
jgi:hypothetical protein